MLKKKNNNQHPKTSLPPFPCTYYYQYYMDVFTDRTLTSTPLKFYLAGEVCNLHTMLPNLLRPKPYTQDNSTQSYQISLIIELGEFSLMD